MIESRYAVLVQVLACLACLMLPALKVSAQDPFRVPDKQVKSIINRLADSTSKFRNTFNKELKKAPPNPRRNDASITQSVDGLNTQVKVLRDKFNSKQATSADVDDLLRRASPVNNYTRRNSAVAGADASWGNVSQNIESLAEAYGVKWNGSASRAKAYRLSDKETKAVLDKIKSGSEPLRRDVEKLLKIDRSTDNQTRKSIDNAIKGFGNRAGKARERVGSGDSGASEVGEVLRQGGEIDRFLRTNRNRLNTQVQGDWKAIRDNLRELAKAYKVSFP